MLTIQSRTIVSRPNVEIMSAVRPMRKPRLDNVHVIEKATIVKVSLKGGPNANFFSSYVRNWIRLGLKRSPKKFQGDDVIMGSTEVKLVRF